MLFRSGMDDAVLEMQQQRALKLQNDMAEIRVRQMQEQERKINISRALANLAAQINRTAPKMVDTSTRLDGAVAAPERFTYYFTIISMQADQISPALKANMASKLRSTSCNDASLRATLNNGVSLGYSYRDRSGIDTFAVTVIQSDCR